MSRYDWQETSSRKNITLPLRFRTENSTSVDNPPRKQRRLPPVNNVYKAYAQSLLWEIRRRMRFTQKRLTLGTKQHCCEEFRVWFEKHCCHKPNYSRSKKSPDNLNYSFSSVRDLDFLFGKDWEIRVERSSTGVDRKLECVTTRLWYSPVKSCSILRKTPIKIQFSKESFSSVCSDGSLQLEEQHFVKLECSFENGM